MAVVLVMLGSDAGASSGVKGRSATIAVTIFEYASPMTFAATTLNRYCD
jgi:hypothetical protein